MRRSSRRGRQDHPSHRTSEEEKPSQINPKLHLEQSSTTSTSSHHNPDLPSSESLNKTSASYPNRRNSRWGSRNRRRRGSSSGWVEVGHPPSNGDDGVVPEEGKSINLIDDSVGGRSELGSSSNYCNGDSSHKEHGNDHLCKSSMNDSGEGRIEWSDSIESVDDVGSRLEVLQIGAQEPDLSEELLQINDQVQEDELLAMESIYGDNVFILDKQRGLRSIQIHIYVEAPSELSITARLNQPSGTEITMDTSDEFSYSFKIQHLPPIVLTCLLPKSYPSHLPPYFTISVQWLDSSKISNLCSMLDSLWEEQPGQEVLYHWVEWLHNSSLSYLGFENEIVLGPYGLRYSGDKRAISGSISPEVDIPSLKSYNDGQHQENFLRNFHPCCICFSEFAGSDFVRLPCQHFFCWKCMKTYSDMHVKDGTVSKLLCPNSKCGGMIPPGLLKRLLGDEEFKRWESLMLEKTLAAMSDVVCCPRCETACIADEDEHAQCSKCFFSFCTVCSERRHVGNTCLTPEIKLKILEDRQNSSGLLNNEQRRRELEMINELLSVKEILRDAKQCPTCKMAISRIEGCNKMICENCRQYFCYRCNEAIDGYDHFKGGTCELFPRETIQNWENQLNNRQIVAQAQAELFADRGHSCPLCGQMNVKVDNNNHMFCWACQNHYCYLCRKAVRRSTQHYGPKGCKQHTAG